MIKIKLSQTEIELAVLHGTARMMQNKQNGASSRGVRKLDPDIIGVGGEIVVCRYFNVYPDLTVGPHYRGHDLTFRRLKIDVKTTGYNPGYLQAKTNKKASDCDIFILVHADFPTFTILGGSRSNELLQDYNIKNMGYGDNYVLEQSQLTEIGNLFA